METIPDGGILSARGFRVGSARCGIKSVNRSSGAGDGDEPDVALIVSEGPASAAGVFTTNRFAAPAVAWNRQNLPAADVRAVVVNSGNANACTGEQGAADVRSCAELAAELVGSRPTAVCVASTGIIGHPLPMGKLLDGIRQAHGNLSDTPEVARAAERAIMTTDTRPKAAAVRAEVRGAPFHVGGMAKGAGMIAPHMATMLAFITTDAALSPPALQEAVRAAAEQTFNRITIDGDSSTNDTVLVLAGGRSEARVEAAEGGASRFREALHAVMESLARQIVADGEGATTLVTVEVRGAADDAEAATAARAVAESQLFKCALHGRDPNWGRIVCALGYSGAQVSPERTTVRIGKVPVFEGGKPTGRDATAEMAADQVAILIDLGAGTGSARFWTCDLSAEYVRINAEYPT
ncbi:MAG: bifunctional glutamate N-acetyltransferase/amino-acid acetyltransferase ArgJ [Planctomycetota bacterium]|jgi:glutamate N-acetyltransferase/amino-acid N-acetyltransferase